jgi:hypothetical protein
MTDAQFYLLCGIIISSAWHEEKALRMINGCVAIVFLILSLLSSIKQ